MNWSALPSLLSVLIGVIVFLGALYVYLQGAKDKAATESAERTIASYKSELEIVTLRLKRQDEQIAEHTTQIAVLRSENEELRRQRPSAEIIAEMSTVLLAHDQQSEKNDTEILSMLRKLVPR